METRSLGKSKYGVKGSQVLGAFGLLDFTMLRPILSSVGIATDYGLDGPGIESRWGRDFSHTSRPTLGPTQAPVQWVPGLPGVKRPGRGADHPPPPSAEVDNE
jgi:hypothetical protein